jgi:hypothetical protein
MVEKTPFRLHITVLVNTEVVYAMLISPALAESDTLIVPSPEHCRRESRLNVLLPVPFGDKDNVSEAKQYHRQPSDALRVESREARRAQLCECRYHPHPMSPPKDGPAPEALPQACSWGPQNGLWISSGQLKTMFSAGWALEGLCGGTGVGGGCLGVRTFSLSSPGGCRTHYRTWPAMDNFATVTA